MKFDVTKLPLGEALIGLVLVGVVGTFILAFAFGPGGFARDELVAAPPEAEPTQEASPTPTGSPPAGTAVEVAMIPTIKFDTTDIAVPAGQPVTLTADNIDPGIPHNWALYTDETASEQLAATRICTDCKETITFDPPDTGVYFFRCDVHPTQMVGTFTVE